MKKLNRLIAAALALSMMLSVSACKVNFGIHGKTLKYPTGTAATETGTEATTTTTSETSESTKATESEGYPEKGCKIEFKPQDQRYHYDMDLTLDKEKNTVGGHVVFTFFNDSDTGLIHQ